MKKTILAATTLTVGFAATGFSALVLSEPFTYPDGPLVGDTPAITAGGTPWFTASGTAGQMDTLANVVNITSAESEDLGIAFAPVGFFYNTGTLTATFDITFSALPNAAGTYFAHFRDTGNFFRGRVYASTTGATTGFRLGISDSTNAVATTAFIPVDLSLSTQYSLTLSLDNATGRSSLAIAGVNGGTPVFATDPASPGAINGFGLRQAAGEGTLTLDNLVVNDTASPVPEPTTILTMISGLGMLGLLRRRTARR